MIVRHNHHQEIFILFCFSLIVFMWGIRYQEVISFDSRFYLFALEMWKNGPTWFPTVYQQPYPDYPGTGTFLIYLCAKFFGGLNKWVAVFPTAIAASLTVVVTYLIGLLHSKRWGLYSVVFLFFTAAFLKEARSIALDIYPTLITTICFYLVYAADLNHRPRLAYWIYHLLVLSFAFRGPIGLIIPAAVISTYYVLSLQLKKLFIFLIIVLLLLMISTTLLLMLAYYTGGWVFLQDVLNMEILKRIANNHIPLYFYLVTGFRNYALSFPVAGFIILAMVYYYRRMPISEQIFLRNLIGCVLIILIGMSIPGGKKTRYLLPMVPMLSLIAACPFVTNANHKLFSCLRNLMFLIFQFLPIILLTIVAALFYVKNTHFDTNISYLGVTLLLILLQLFNIVIGLKFIETAAVREIRVMFIATLSFIISYISVIEPIDLYNNKAHAFVAKVESVRKQQQASLAFYQMSEDGFVIKYLINMCSYQEKPLFIVNEERLKALSTPAFFVTTKENFNKLSPGIFSDLTIIASDKVGHVDIVVFKK